MRIGGSLEQSLSQGYRLDLKGVLQESWQQTRRTGFGLLLAVGLVSGIGVGVLSSRQLAQAPQLGRDFLAAQVHVEQAQQLRLPDVAASELQQAWRDILRRAKLVQHHKISREALSVREHMSILLRRLQGRRFVEFAELFELEQGVPVLVVTFIAMLELAKETLIEITQAEAFAPIYVRLAYTPA
mgnify:CR=1 FL=1